MWGGKVKFKQKLLLTLFVLIILLASGCNTIRDLYGMNEEQPVPHQVQNKKECESECEKFNYTFYKSGGNYNYLFCSCMVEGEPIKIW